MLTWVLEDEFHSLTVGQYSSFTLAEEEVKKRLSLPKAHKLNRGPCSSLDCPKMYRIIECDDATTPWTELSSTDYDYPEKD